MSDQDESVWVVFNGEIYNFPELKHELEAHGHNFRTNPTLKSSSMATSNGAMKYLITSMACLAWRFGMRGEKRLVLARDPFGIKLIYYRIEKGAVVLWLRNAGRVAAT